MVLIQTPPACIYWLGWIIYRAMCTLGWCYHYSDINITRGIIVSSLIIKEAMGKQEASTWRKLKEKSVAFSDPANDTAPRNSSKFMFSLSYQLKYLVITLVAYQWLPYYTKITYNMQCIHLIPLKVICFIDTVHSLTWGSFSSIQMCLVIWSRQLLKGFSHLVYCCNFVNIKMSGN